MHKILWDAIKAVLRGKFMTVNAYIKQKERSQIKSITQSSTLRKKQKTKPKASRRKEMIKIRVDISGITEQKAIEKINETKSWLFEKINKTDKPLAKLTRKKRKEDLNY